MKFSVTKAPRSSQQQLVNPTAQAEGSVAEAPKEMTAKIPPIVLKTVGDWTVVCTKIYARKINYAKAKMTEDGVAITPSTQQDYRTLAKMLNEEKKEYHTYSHIISRQMTSKRTSSAND